MAQYLDDVFHALSDPTRRSVLRTLAEGPASVTVLAEPFDMGLPSFMKHIRLLERSGWIRTRKTGRVRTCTIDSSRFAVVDDWLADHRAAWERRTDRLEQFVLEQTQPNQTQLDQTQKEQR
jgi:DNA-binding transcriptional ArsR family regulator